MEKRYLRLENISAYKIAFELSNYVWDIVNHWNYFAKDTVGKQFVRSIDSISANIAEGFHRYFKKEKIQFYRYSFGSMGEAGDWNKKANVRKLLIQEEYNHILQELEKLPREVNNLINFTNYKLQH